MPIRARTPAVPDPRLGSSSLAQDPCWQGSDPLPSEPRASQLGSCRDKRAGKACLAETKPFAAARERIRSIITLRSPFSNQLIAEAVNSLSQGRLAGTRGRNNCALACLMWLSSFKKKYFFFICFFLGEALCHAGFHK